MANHITDVQQIHKCKIHVFSQLHGKMFVTWNRLRVCIRILRRSYRKSWATIFCKV